jgi:hypothetical protein
MNEQDRKLQLALSNNLNKVNNQDWNRCRKRKPNRVYPWLVAVLFFWLILEIYV